MTCLELNIKYWTSTDLNSMRWLGLFKNKIFRKHLKLIFPHRDFIIFIVSLAIFHTHFSIRILSSAFCHPHFVIRIFLSAIRRHPVRTLQRPVKTCSFQIVTIAIADKVDRHTDGNFSLEFKALSYRKCFSNAY